MNLDNYRRLLELRAVKDKYDEEEKEKEEQKTVLQQELDQELKRNNNLIEELTALEKNDAIIEYEKEHWPLKTNKEKKNLLNKQLYNIPNYSKKSPNPDEVILEKNERDEWLRILHERYSEKFSKDNDRIWTVTSIFLPLSLAGLSSVKDGSVTSTVLLGLGSIALMIFWFLVCEKHRAFQESTESIVKAIEKQVGLETKLAPLDDPFKKQKFPEKTKTWPVIVASSKALENIIIKNKEYSDKSRLSILKNDIKDILFLAKQVRINRDVYIVLRRPLALILRNMNIQMGRVFMFFTVTALWIAAILWTICKGDTPNNTESKMVIIHQWTMPRPLDFPPLWLPF